MTDAQWQDATDTVAEILISELAEVTEEMVEAASKAAEAAAVEIGADGKRRLRPCTEADLHTVVWRAMLAAKLAGRR